LTVVNETYDVFVSYSRADWRHPTDIDSALRARGLKPFFDRRNLFARRSDDAVRLDSF
jgi:hypothetical protein